MDKPRSFAPIVAVMLCLFPVLYMGTYLALVVPGGISYSPPSQPLVVGSGAPRLHYRLCNRTASRAFWPLEQIDRRMRPAKWEWWRNDRSAALRRDFLIGSHQRGSS